MLRSGTVEDLESVAELHTASWRSAYAGIMPGDYLDGPLLAERLELWRNRLGTPEPEGRLFVAEEAGELAGFVYLTTVSDGRILLDNLHVRPAAKRGGIGSVLLRHGLYWTAVAHAGRDLYLEVLRDNTAAIAFYERHGGQRTDERTARFVQGFELAEVEYTWTAETLATLPPQ